MKANEIVTAIMSNDVTREELRWISSAITDRLRYEEQKAKSQFRTGDLVEFDSAKRNVRVRGIVVKVAKTTVHVSQEGRLPVIWRVSPSLLRKVTQAVQP